jgi:hypothetical protein
VSDEDGGVLDASEIEAEGDAPQPDGQRRRSRARHIAT